MCKKKNNQVKPNKREISSISVNFFFAISKICNFKLF